MVVLVDERDKPIGIMEKYQAHLERKLHRAFSVFGFREDGKFLLHQRASSKYHSASLWTNTCCSHPFPFESVTEAANRRVKEELGATIHSVKPVGHLRYDVPLDNDFFENEYDHILVARIEENLSLNADEVDSAKWVELSEVKQDVDTHPEKYTVWFQLILKDNLLFEAIMKQRDEIVG